MQSTHTTRLAWQQLLHKPAAQTSQPHEANYIRGPGPGSKSSNGHWCPAVSTQATLVHSLCIHTGKHNFDVKHQHH